jgi:hypothetical protein
MMKCTFDNAKYDAINDLYRNKLYNYETEKLMDKYVGNEYYCEILRASPSKWEGINFVSFEIESSNFRQTHSESVFTKIFYFFDENGNLVRNPIAVRSGAEAARIFTTSSARININTDLIKFGSVVSIYSHVSHELQNIMIGKFICPKYKNLKNIKIWNYTDKNKENIKSAGIAYSTSNNDSEKILSAEIDANNKLSLEVAGKKFKKAIGYKIAMTNTGKYCIVTLIIPENALVASNGSDHKLRTNMAYIAKIEILDIDGENITIAGTTDEAASFVYRNKKYTYTKGQTQIIDNFEGDLNKICVPGIHFYLDRISPLYYITKNIRHKIIDNWPKTWNYGFNYFEFDNSKLINIKQWLLVQKRLIPQMPNELTQYIIEFIIHSSLFFNFVGGRW